MINGVDSNAVPKKYSANRVFPLVAMADRKSEAKTVAAPDLFVQDTEIKFIDFLGESAEHVFKGWGGWSGTGHPYTVARLTTGNSTQPEWGPAWVTGDASAYMYINRFGNNSTFYYGAHKRTYNSDLEPVLSGKKSVWELLREAKVQAGLFMFLPPKLVWGVVGEMDAYIVLPPINNKPSFGLFNELRTTPSNDDSKIDIKNREARETAKAVLSHWGNPVSLHSKASSEGPWEVRTFTTGSKDVPKIETIALASGELPLKQSTGPAIVLNMDGVATEGGILSAGLSSNVTTHVSIEAGAASVVVPPYPSSSNGQAVSLFGSGVSMILR